MIKLINIHNIKIDLYKMKIFFGHKKINDQISLNHNFNFKIFNQDQK